MPGGISNPIVGGAAFVAIKLVGYTLAARPLMKGFIAPDASIYSVGGVRTLIGIVFGTVYFGLASVVFPNPFVLLGLIPIRVVEWLLLIKIFYDGPVLIHPRAPRVAGLGTLWSFVLDIPAIFGFIAVAGFWVC